jgi:hypothetical protein
MAYVSVGGVYATSANDFLDSYHGVIGGGSSTFKHSPAYGVGLKFWLTDHYRMSVAADYFKSDFYDYFDQADSLNIGNVERNIAEQISASTLPITLSIDFIPLEQQFKTYVSLGTGIVISKVNWTEKVNSNRQSDPRKGGEHYGETQLFPLVRTAVGVELNFDKSVAGNVVGSLTFELRYTYMFRNIDLFGEVKNQFENGTSSLEGQVAFLPGYLSLNLQFGIEFFQKLGR